MDVAGPQLLLRGKAIKQPIAPRAAQSLGIAASRRMRGIPGTGPGSANGPGSIMVPQHRRTIGTTLAPVAAGHIGEWRTWKRRAIRPRTGQHVMHVGVIRATVNGLPLFV